METKAVLSLTRRHNLADMYTCVAKALKIWEGKKQLYYDQPEYCGLRLKQNRQLRLVQ